jgi:hypothetical protein
VGSLLVMEGIILVILVMEGMLGSWPILFLSL